MDPILLVREADRLHGKLRRAGENLRGQAGEDIMPRLSRLGQARRRAWQRVERRSRAVPIHPRPLIPAELDGRALDTAIAEFVCGYRREIVGPDASGEHGGGVVLVPPTMGDNWYNTLPLKGAVPPGWYAHRWHEDEEQALWLLDQRFPAIGHEVTLVRFGTGGGSWRCTIARRAADAPHLVEAVGATLPLAICRAALTAALALRGEVAHG